MKNYSVLVLSCMMLFSGGIWAHETSLKGAVDCDNPMTTIEINDCAKLTVDEAQTRLDKYIAKANEKYHDDPKAVEALQLSQRDWLTYRESYCHAIYQLWRNGSIRGVMYHECMLQLTVQRTHNIWQDYLTFMDSSEPLLPEPQ
ncbi:lysozyme inhibitor LprI family protein [Shewanella sp. A14]